MAQFLFPWRLISFHRVGDAQTVQVGLLEENCVVDLTGVFMAAGQETPDGIRQVLERFSTDDLAREIGRANRSKNIYSLADVSILAPVTNPGTFYDFLGFEQHVRQIRDRRGATVPDIWYKRPAYYLGSVARDKILGPGTVVIPRFVEKPDYECEIALIIGKKGRPKSKAEARAFIQSNCFFTLCNDWSARDYQKLDMELGLGVSHSKSIIGTSFGPALVHASQFRFNPEGAPDIPICLTVNGEPRAETNYQTVYWNFAKILAFLGGENISVFPGDVLGSGTIGSGSIAEFAAKVIEGQEVEPAKYPWLKNGDEVTLTAEGIGSLTNKVKIQ